MSHYLPSIEPNLKEVLENASSFQRKVFEIVLTIPKGETRTYQWVAEKLGNPKAFRAVGNALSKNPCPIIIPCHRIIRKDGKLGGYIKGEQEKRRLLERENINMSL